MTVLALQVSDGDDDGINYYHPINMDDSWAHDVAGHSVGNNFAYAPNSTREEVACRFTGVSGLSGATINSATYSVYGFYGGGAGSPLTKISAEDAAAPAQISPDGAAGGDEFVSRPLTTAGVDWDGTLTDNAWNDSPDIASVIQELADSYDPSVIQIFHKDDGSSSGHAQAYDTYENDSAAAPKLTIDYTPAASSLGSNNRRRRQCFREFGAA